MLYVNPQNPYRMRQKIHRNKRSKFESPADAGLSNRSIGAEAPAAAFGKTASADFMKQTKREKGKNKKRNSSGPAVHARR